MMTKDELLQAVIDTLQQHPLEGDEPYKFEGIALVYSDADNFYQGIVTFTDMTLAVTHLRALSESLDEHMGEFIENPTVH